MERSYYPGYSVMSQEHEWDDHTRQIVKGRLGPFPSPQHLNSQQAATLRSVVSLLTDEQRPEILDYLVDHFDRKVGAKVGHDQRKKGLPPFKELLLAGLKALEQCSHGRVKYSFSSASDQEQADLVRELEQGKAQPPAAWSGIPQQEFFNHLLEETVAAYYSHPTIWSEIGYAGPAYPRGYMRSELGLTEPWEARQDGK